AASVSSACLLMITILGFFSLRSGTPIQKGARTRAYRSPRLTVIPFCYLPITLMSRICKRVHQRPRASPRCTRPASARLFSYWDITLETDEFSLYIHLNRSSILRGAPAPVSIEYSHEISGTTVR